MSEAPAPADSGPLSVDQAIAALTPTPQPEAEAAPEAPVEAAAEPDEIEGEASAPEEADAEGETPAEAEEAEAEAEPVVAADPPAYWSKDAKAVFAAMTPEQQAVVLAQEGPREEITAKVKAEAAAERQAANAELGKVQALADHLNNFLPKAIETFKATWGDAPDWRAYAEQYGADAMVIAKVEHDEQLALLQKTAQAASEAQAVAKATYFDAEHKALAQLAPDLADPVEGPKRRAEVVSYLRTVGYDDGEMEMMSARDMLIAQKAKLYDAAQAKLKAGPPPKPAPAAAQRSPVRPAAAVAQAPQRTVAANRFAQTRSVDDAVALLLSGKT